jgi:hypothetical protein
LIDLDVDVRISRWIFKKKNSGYGVDESGSEQEPVLGSLDYGNEPSDSTKCSEFLEWLSNYWLLRKDSVP